MFKRTLILLALAAPAGAQSFQPGRLPAASRDSFDVIYQGQPIGAFIISGAKTGDSYALVAEARLPRMGVNQVDSIVFNATSMAPTLIAGSQSMMGASIGAHITVADGRAKGTMQRPGPAGIQTDNVDVAVPPGVLADGTEAALIPTLEFSDALTFGFQTFEAKTGKVKSYVLKVAGKESVTVPAGTIESWKIELASDENVTMWVSAADPKRLVMLRLEGAQMEMRRANK